jgi:hypothetical protein
MKTISMATDVEQKLEARAGAFDDRVHGRDRAMLDVAEPSAGVRRTQFRHHDQADQDRRRRAEHRADDDMPGGVGNCRRQYGRIEHEHRAGDAGHAAGHHHEHFGARELGEIRADEERRLDLANEDVGRGREPDRAADVERALERMGEAAHDRRHDAPVEEKRGDDAHHQHDGERLEGETEFRSGRLELERQRPAADVAEHERGAGLGRRRDRSDSVVDPHEGVFDLRHLEEEECEREGDGKPDRSLPPGDRAAVLTDEPSDNDYRRDAQRRLQVCHVDRAPIPQRG